MKYLIMIVLIALSIVVFKQYDEINNLNSRISNLNVKLEKVAVHKKANTKELFNQQFKEDYYLNQLSNSTSLVLTVIGVALVLAGIFSFKLIDDKFIIFKSSIDISISDVDRKYETITSGFDEKINFFTDKINGVFSKNEDKYKKLELKFTNLKNDLDFEAATLKANEANKCLGYADFENYIFYSLYSNRFRARCVSFYKEQENVLADSLTQQINSSLEIVLQNLKSSPDYERNGNKIFISSDKTLMNLVNEINEINDKKVFKKLSEIYSILEFQD